MRLELQTIAYIEQYLLHTLTDAEINLFEERMATDPDFKNEVELQELLIKGLEHISLQQTIQNAQKTYAFWKLFKLIGMILIPVLLILTTWYFTTLADKASTETETVPTKVEQEIYKETTSKTVSKDKEVAIIPDTIPKQKAVKVTKMKTTIYAENTVVDPLETIVPEFFTIAAKKDTIIETQNGIVFLIPENTFVDKNKNVIHGNIQVKIKEAVDSHTIMTSGLSTLFNDKPLETGGMFFIEAKKDGETLQIHPDKEITADIPTQDYKEGMQLFDGEKAEDGTINWTNPKPLNKALIPQDIYSLNFYPPAYLEILSEKGYDPKDKKFTDSLYYSFSNTTVDKTLSNKIKFTNDALDIGRPRDSVIVQKDSIKSDRTAKKGLLGLDPLKVKAIWNERYQNTFIATKAFEERLRVIHQNCTEANAIFDLYVQNLDRDLYEVDEMIVTKYKYTSLREQFEVFAAQKLTNVANLNSDVAKLNTYYMQQQKVYRLALIEAQEKMDSLMRVDKKYLAFSKEQLQSYYLNELSITTAKVANDFGVRLPRSFNQTRSNRTQISRTNTVSSKITSVTSTIKKEKRKRRYRAPIRTTGWKNIDRILNEDVVSSIKSRTTTTVKTRKKSVTISYSEYEVSIENTERFDKLFVYLVPTKFNSFVRLKAENGRFTYKLNDLLKYRVHCIGYLNDVPYYIDKTIKNTSDKLKLRQITTETLRERLANMNNENSSLETEISYQATRKTNQRRLKRYREIVKLKRELKSIVFPCQQYKTVKSLLNDALEAETREVDIVDVIEDIEEIPFAFVEIAPIFPGCETLNTEVARKKCMSEKIQRFINREFDTSVISEVQQLKGTQRINAVFKIDTSGIVNDIRVRSNHPKLDAEAKRVIQSLPKMIPATQRGNSINVRYTLPIIFKVGE